jgi:molybdopterin synthase catalytic subunit
MANPVCELIKTKEELERPLPSLDESAGAVLDFRGVVRAIEEGRRIDGIDYEAHPAMAEHQLRLIAEEAIERFRLTTAVIRHRTGFVPAGEASLLARVTAPHRQSAIDAMEWLVNELKKKVPIWKHPQFQASEPSKNTKNLQLEESVRK